VGNSEDWRDCTQLYIEALSHPLRREILVLAVEKDEPISPVRVSRELEQHLSNVTYHMKVLADHGLMRLAFTEPARGAVEHFYIVERVPLGHPLIKALLHRDS
jgi:DNA-binding transcriptional ArsR family regulator